VGVLLVLVYYFATFSCSNLVKLASENHLLWLCPERNRPATPPYFGTDALFVNPDQARKASDVCGDDRR
jgi:hypothetical protein